MEERMNPMAYYYREALEAHRALFATMNALEEPLTHLAEAVIKALKTGGKLIFFGNGGSAADAQHLAAELVNRFVLDRPALAGLALTTDTSSLTAIANDSAYDQVFVRQLEALGQPGDVALGISTSGNSANIVAGIRRAGELGMVTAAFTGQGGGKLAGIAHHLIAIPSKNTGRIQEGHIFAGHLLCEMIERTMVETAPSTSSALEASQMPSPREKTSSTPPAAFIHPSKGEEGRRREKRNESSTPPAAFIHPSSYVDEGVTLGAGTKIWHFSHVQTGARIGEFCILGQNVNIGPNVVIGQNVKIQNNVSVYQGVIVEDDVFLGPSMVFTNVVNPRSHVNRKSEFKETRVGRGASIGANATLICGHSIGRYAFIGAGAVVTRSVPDYALALGNPARVVGWMCRCGTRLELPATPSEEARACCPACRGAYIFRKRSLQEDA